MDSLLPPVPNVTATNSGNRSYRRKMQRTPVDQRPGFQVTERDLDIMEAVYTHRMLTTTQIETLIFPSTPGKRYSKHTACQRRLRYLFDGGYLARDERPRKSDEPRQDLLYFLDKEGAKLVVKRQGKSDKDLDWRPADNQLSPITLDHRVAINDARAAIEVAARNGGCTVAPWLDEKTLMNTKWRARVEFGTSQGKSDQAYILPDGYFCLYSQRYSYPHFLEVDLATETVKSKRYKQRDFATKLRAYRAFYESGEYKRRYENEAIFRVLTITTAPARLQNLKDVSAEIDRAGGMFLFTTLNRLTPETALHGAIWEVAGEAEPGALLFDDE